MQDPSSLRIIRRIDRINETVGRATSWLCLVLILVTVTDVAMRYGFSRGSIAMQEMEWHLFSLIFLLGAGYTLKHNAHVRVDILYARLSARRRAWIDLLGGLLLLVPFVVAVIYTSVDFVGKAWEVREHSVNPGGLPTWYLLKTVIPIAFALLGLQAASEILRALLVLTGRPTGGPDGTRG